MGCVRPTPVASPPLQQPPFWIFEWGSSSVAEADGREEDEQEDAQEEDIKLFCEQELASVLPPVLMDDSQIQLEVCSLLEEVLTMGDPVSPSVLTPPLSPTRVASRRASNSPGTSIATSQQRHPVASARELPDDSETVEMEVRSLGSTSGTSSSVYALNDSGVMENSFLNFDELVALSQSSECARLSRDEAHTLPRVRFEAPEMQVCSICMENFRHGMVLIGLACRHIFHVDCLTQWVQRSAQCPNCRTQIQPYSQPCSPSPELIRG